MPQQPAAPMSRLRLPLLTLLLLATAAAAAVGVGPSPPPATTTPWPEKFHAVVVTNLTGSGGRLQKIDIYYDWPRGSALNVIRNQLTGDPLRDVQWVNGTSYLLSLLRRKKKAGRDGGGGAAYLGRKHVDGFDCHRYFEDVVTGFPVAWIAADGMERHVLSFEPGAVLEDCSKWQAPAYCFNGSNADAPASSP
ncbi:hypothetical protein HU200_046393 [Digitaria exilis]|uniref:Uncharacterized protein n=1 Tax=Digitaria exilis TaxID=1010633 RepID=A0A835B9T6_9POAL|nr:hypothetical protein HU200_046393 [Digitaria exilis]